MREGLPSIQLDAVSSPSGGVSDGGLQAVSQAYGDLARAARGIASAVRQDETEDGARDALEAFNKAAAETPAGERVSVPERKGGLLDRLGVRAEAYENAVQLLSVQRAEQDARRQLSLIATENFGSPAAFQRSAREWVSGYLEKAPADVAPQIEKALQDRLDEFYSNAVIDRQKLDLQEARQSTDAELQALEDDLIRMADTDGIAAFRSPQYIEKQTKILDLLDAKAANPAFVYSEKQRDLDLDRVTRGVALRAASATIADEIKDTLDFGGVGAAKAKLSELLQTDVFTSLDRSDQKKLRLAGEQAIGQREREIKAAIAEQKREYAAYQSEQYGGLLASVIKGDAGLADVERAREEGKISLGQYASLLDRTIKTDKGAEDLRSAYDLLSGGAPINPGDSNHRKAVDLVFKDRGGDKLLREDPAAGVEAALAVAQEHGVLPDSAVSTLRAHIANGSAEQQQAALDNVTRLLESEPAAARAVFKDNEIAEAAYYSDLVAYGAPPEFALTSIMKAREARFDPAAKERRSQGAKIAAKEISRGDTLAAIGAKRDAPDVRIFGEGAAIDGAQAQFRRLFVEHYATHGDAERAKKQAAAVVGRHFGETRATGQRRIMMYPPEQYYAVKGADPKWMQKQLERDVSQVVGAEVRARDLQLIADSQTAAEAQAGFAPTYSVVRRREDGAWEALTGRRYAFDATEAQRAVDYENFVRIKDAEDERKEKIEDAADRELLARLRIGGPR